MKKIIAAIILSCTAMSAYATDRGITMTLRSNHVGSVGVYNENNPGIGYTWKTDVAVLGDVNAHVGVYRNSEYRTSAYISAVKYLWTSGGFGAGYTVGLATGYESTPIMPILGAVVSYTVNDTVGINVVLSAFSDDKDNDKLKPLIGVQLVFPF